LLKPAAYAKDQGKTMHEQLLDIYKEFGLSRKNSFQSRKRANPDRKKFSK